MNNRTDRGLQLRVQALALLQEAEAIDGLKPFTVTHTHRYLMREKSVHGFRTGDMVKAVVSKGKKVGTYTGRVAVRATGNFNIQTSNGVVQGVAHRYCTVMQRGDGYSYSRVATMDATKGTPPQHRDALHRALSLPAVNDRVSRAI